jgi:hypothetical protein
MGATICLYYADRAGETGFSSGGAFASGKTGPRLALSFTARDARPATR